MLAIKASISIYHDQIEALQAIREHTNAKSLSSVVQAAIHDYLKKHKNLQEVRNSLKEHDYRRQYKEKREKYLNP
jgi:metal-responsive CopG/Arc/MetJ family transcriptional regulator